MILSRSLQLSLLFMALGCAGTRVVAPARPRESPISVFLAFEKRLQALDAQYEAMKIAYSCASVIAPGQTCGLLFEEFFDPERQQAFAVAECGETTARTLSPDCFQRWNLRFLARLLQRYPRGDLEAARAACRRQGSACDNAGVVEPYLFASHNDAIDADRLRARRSLERERDAAVAAAARGEEQEEAAESRRRAAIHAFADELAQPRSARVKAVESRRSDCSSDYDCAYGMVCAKPGRSLTGFCATPVHEDGTRTYPLRPSPDTLRRCRYDHDCSYGFRCRKDDGLEGICVK